MKRMRWLWEFEFIYFFILVCNIRSAGPVADGFFLSLLFESFRQFSCELNWKFRCYFKKNKIHISQVIGFQSTLRIIAFAKKTLLGHKNWQKTLYGGMGVYEEENTKNRVVNFDWEGTLDYRKFYCLKSVEWILMYSNRRERIRQPGKRI